MNVSAFHGEIHVAALRAVHFERRSGTWAAHNFSPRHQRAARSAVFLDEPVARESYRPTPVAGSALRQVSLD